LDSSSSDDGKNSSKHHTTSKHKHQDQRERKIDVAVSKRLIGHALNQKSVHRNGHLYGDGTVAVDRNYGNRRNRQYQDDDGSHSTQRHSNRFQNRQSEHEKRNSRKNRNSDGPSVPRNGRWNKDFSSSKPQSNRQGNEKSSGNNRRNESFPKPKTASKQPEFNIISSSEAIGVAAASNWAEDSDSDEGW